MTEGSSKPSRLSIPSSQNNVEATGWPNLSDEHIRHLFPRRGEQWARILFPARCVLCGTVLPLQAALLVCDPCRCLLEPEAARWLPCPDWPELDGWFSPFPYAGGIRLAIREMKYQDQPRHADTLALLLAESLRDMPGMAGFTGIIPVPMHKKRQRSRGYNQAELLAHGLSEATGIPVLRHLVRKERQTASQNGQDRHARLSALSASFSPWLDSAVPEVPHLLLLDDVATTGSTLRACAAAVRAACTVAGHSRERVVLRAVTMAYA